MHALDPQSIPTKAAVDCATVVVDRLLERLRADAGGEYPETVAFTLWGTDNIKTYGKCRAYFMREAITSTSLPCFITGESRLFLRFLDTAKVPVFRES